DAPVRDRPAPQLGGPCAVQLAGRLRAEPPQRLERRASRLAPVDGPRARLLRQLLAGRPGQYRQMQIGGLREAERALEVTLRGDAVEQIPPADNRRHPLIAVVDH